MTKTKQEKGENYVLQPPSSRPMSKWQVGQCNLKIGQILVYHHFNLNIMRRLYWTQICEENVYYSRSQYVIIWSIVGWDKRHKFR
jgi:hypothetical protein